MSDKVDHQREDDNAASNALTDDQLAARLERVRGLEVKLSTLEKGISLLRFTLADPESSEQDCADAERHLTRMWRAMHNYGEPTHSNRPARQMLLRLILGPESEASWAATPAERAVAIVGQLAHGYPELGSGTCAECAPSRAQSGTGGAEVAGLPIRISRGRSWRDAGKASSRPAAT